MNEEKGQGAQKVDEVKAAADTGEARSSSSTASEPLVDGNGKQKPHSSPSSSSLANKIAAFASGVAPVKKGITNASEDGITVEEVLHKLESAARAAASSGKAELPQQLVRSSYDALVAARDDSARLAKELTELKNSRVQLIPPSAWVKREHKYKMDQEKHEHTVSMMQQRIERLELELQVLREGSNVKPLEQRIAELETQLLAASEEKTKVQSKYHELSIKHRQLIETSPQVATIWNEVLQQQHASGTSGDSAAMQRLTNFDLRHTGANSGMVMPVAAVQLLQAQQQKRNGEASPRQLSNVNAATAIFSHGGPVAPAPAAYEPKLTAAGGSSHTLLSEAGSIEQGPETPVLSDAASHIHAGSCGGAAAAAVAPAGPQTAEERAAALMAAVALEGLSPEASLAALQQLNYDLTMQLGLYQQMVARLKDAMEQGDLEKAELEADKLALEAQLHVLSSAVATAAGGSAGDHSHAAALMATANSGGLSAASVASGGSSRAGRGGWGFFWRRAGAGNTVDDEQAEGSLADASSIGLASLSSSRRSSMDLDAAQQQQMGAGGSPTLQHSSSKQSGAAPGTPNSSTAEDADGQQQQQQQQQPLQRSNSGDSSPPPHQQRRVGSSSSPPLQPAGSGSSPAPAAAASSVAALFGGRRARAAARAATTADSLQKEMKELRRQLTSVQDENKFLVQNLVEIKMELAETQSSHDQAKRALVRAMDKEACLDMRVGELTHMLDLATQQQPQQGFAGIAAVMAEGAVSVAESAGAAAAAAITAAGAEYKKTCNRRAASRRGAQGSGELQQGSVCEGVSVGASDSGSLEGGACGAAVNSEGVSESGAEEEGGSSSDGADDAAGADLPVGSHSTCTISSGEFSEALSSSSSGAGDAGEGTVAAAAAAAGGGGGGDGGDVAVDGVDAADAGGVQKQDAAAAVVVDSSSGSDPVGETVAAGSDSK